MLKLALGSLLVLTLGISSFCGAREFSESVDQSNNVDPIVDSIPVKTAATVVDSDPLATLPQWQFEVFFPMLKIPEPSGLCYHPLRNTMYMVDDGDIDRPSAVFEISLDGEVLQENDLGDDLEAICYCPLDGLLYVADEIGERIYAIDPENLKRIGTVYYSRNYSDKELLHKGGNGVEGIEFIPVNNEPAAGYFILLNQDDPHCLFRINHEDLDFDKDKSVPIRAWWPYEPINAGSLHYVAETEQLWLIHSWMNVVEYIDVPTMEVAGWEVFPGASQEAVAIDGQGRLWVGQDLGGIARYTRPQTTDHGESVDP